METLRELEDLPYRQRTIPFLIERGADRNGDKPFLSVREAFVVYRELEARTRRIGNALLDLGIGKGTDVALMLGQPARGSLVLYRLSAFRRASRCRSKRRPTASC